jgi:hypothetical protein
MPVRDFPSIEPTAIQVIPVIPTVISRALSGRETRDQIGAAYFELNCEFENLDSDERRQIAGHIAAAKGPLLSFYMKLPTSMDDATGLASGTIQIGVAASAGATSVNYIKANATNQLVFKAGDIIQFSNHGKIYEVSEDSTSTGQNGVVKIFPPLVTALTVSETINYENIEILVRYKSDFGYEIRNNLFSTIPVQFVEVVE